MHIEILKPGLLSTIQDRGRLGYRHIGMPTAGWMDDFAATTANILVGNKVHLPVLELTFGGAEFIAHSDLLIACCGGGASLIARGKELPLWKPLYIPSGTKLKFVTNDSGVRQYVAIVGGWCCKEVLNSRSTYLPTHTGGHEGRALRVGDTLHSNQDISLLSGTMLLALSNDQAIAYPKWSVNPLQFVNYQTKSIRFMPGHEYEWFNKETQLKFENSSFNLSQQSNRMGCYFDGPLLKTKVAKELRSTAVSSGTLQVTNSGKIVLLMADSQTTGGYPRIAQLAIVDLPICAQLRPGESIRFEKIDIDQADELLSNRLRHMDSLIDIVKNNFL